VNPDFNKTSSFISEKNIIQLIAKNHETKGIADILFISPKTVENHRSNMCKKIEITGKNALIKWVAEYKSLLKFRIS